MKVSSETSLKRIACTNFVTEGRQVPFENTVGLLQIAQAVLETLKHPSGSQQDSLLGIEKGLVQSLGESRNGELLAQLTQTVTRESDRPVNERSESGILNCHRSHVLRFL